MRPLDRQQRNHRSDEHGGHRTPATRRDERLAETRTADGRRPAPRGAWRGPFAVITRRGAFWFWPLAGAGALLAVRGVNAASLIQGLVGLGLLVGAPAALLTDLGSPGLDGGPRRRRAAGTLLLVSSLCLIAAGLVHLAT